MRGQLSLDSFLFGENGSTLISEWNLIYIFDLEVADSAVNPIPMVWEELDNGLLYPRKPRQESLSFTYSLFQRTRSRFAPV